MAIALRRYELSYEHRPWSVWANAEEIAPLNPLRRVPVLVLDDGVALIESAAILDALDNRVGEERALLPRTGPDRREGLRIAALATGLADKAVALLYEHVLRTAEVRSAVWVERCEAQIRDTLAALEAIRGARAGAWFLGERLSHADIAVGCALRFLGEAHPGLYPASRWPGLVAHGARCEALREFQENRAAAAGRGRARPSYLMRTTRLLAERGYRGAEVPSSAFSVAICIAKVAISSSPTRATTVQSAPPPRPTRPTRSPTHANRFARTSPPTRCTG